MATYQRFELRLVAGLALLAAALMCPRAARAVAKAPVTSRLELAGAPAPGGVARVIWAGVSDVTPAAAELNFFVTGPDGKPQHYAQAITLAAGKAADATLTFPTPLAGTYRVRARLRMTVRGEILARNDELKVAVAAPRRAASAAPLTSGAPSPVKELTIDGDPVSGEIVNSGDENWFHFDLTTTRTVSIINIDTGTLHDMDIAIYGPDDRTRKADQYAPLTPGSYYVKVTGNMGDSTGTYSMIGFGDYPASAPRTLEVNGKSVNGYCESFGDDTWYRFTVKNPGPYTIETLNALNDPYYSYDDTIIELYGPGSQTRLIARDDDGGFEDFSLISQNLAAETYYVKVSSDSNSGVLYGIQVTQGSKGTPVVLKTDGTKVTGKIDRLGDYDWYQFTADRFGKYHVEVTAGTLRSAKCYLYYLGSDGARHACDIVENFADTGQSILSLDPTLAPNTYFIKMESWSDSGNTGDYKIRVERTGSIGSQSVLLNHPAEISSAAPDSSQWYRVDIARDGDYSFFIPLHAVASSADASINVYFYKTPSIKYEDILFSGDLAQPALATTHLTAGTYYFRIDYAGSAKGSYQVNVFDFPIDELYLTTSPAGGTIKSDADVHWNAFRITETNLYSVEVADRNLEGHTATLYGPNDMTTQLAQTTFHGSYDASLMTRRLAPGLYFVKVQGTPGARGTFTIQLRIATVGLTVGQAPQAAEIAAAGTVNLFRFTIGLSDNYTIEMFPGTLTGGLLRLYGPDSSSQFLAKDDHSGMNGLPKIVTRLAPGEYTLIMQGRQAADKGGYSIQVRRTYAPLALDHRPTSVTIRYGGDAAYYALSFSGILPEKFTITTKAGTLKHNYLRLFGPDSDTKLLAQNGQADAKGLARISAWLQPGATYYLKLQGLTAADAGNCQLEAGPTYTPLTLGDPLTTKTLSSAGEIGKFQFYAPTETSYAIETEAAAAPRVSGTFLRLYGPDSDTQYITCNTGTGTMGRIEKVLAPGNYYLTAQTRVASETGNFLIRVRNTVTPLALNDSATAGLIADRNDVDWYSFHADAETDYCIETRAGTLRDDYVYLYAMGDTSAPIALADNFADQKMARLTRRLAPGDYTIGVRGCHPVSDLGTYTIQVRTVILPVAVNGAPIMGAIDFGNESDWYAFTVTTTTTYRVETFAGTMSDTYLRLYGPDDTTKLIGWNGTYGPGQMGKVVMTLKPGTYFAQVRAGHAGVLGSYQFLVRADLLPLTVNPDQLTAATITPVGDIDWYQFTVTGAPGEKKAVEIDTLAETVPDLYVRLYGPGDRTTLLGQYRALGQHFEYFTVQPGTYFLRVQPYTPNAAGAYQIGVESW